VFENRVLRRMFGPRRYEATGGSRRLNNEELHNLYFLPNIIRMANLKGIKWAGNVGSSTSHNPIGLKGLLRDSFTLLIKWAGHVAQIGRIVMYTGRETTKKTKRRWVNNIKLDLGETDGVVWTGMITARDTDQWRALVSTVMNFQVP
jgi:hypothetical protein